MKNTIDWLTKVRDNKMDNIRDLNNQIIILSERNKQYHKEVHEINQALLFIGLGCKNNT